MTDLVVVSLEPWDDVWRRNQHLVSRLLAMDDNLRVLFVEPAADPLHDATRRRVPGWGHSPRLHREIDRLWTMRPLKILPRRLDRRVDERIAEQVHSATQQLSMHSPVLWINDPGAAPVAQQSGWPTLYDITDDWLVADRPDSELQRLGAGEAWLLSHAREVVACSAELVHRKAPDRPVNLPPIALIPNAVDVAAYRIPQKRPVDLPAGKTAVYVGTLHTDRLDVDLCIATARSLGTTAALVLVGPNALSADDSARLRTAGIHLLGSRRRDVIVAYLQHADVLVVPHAVTPFTESLDPIKLYEYLAVGRPVVSTPVAGFRDATSPHTHVANPEFFPATVLNFAACETPLACTSSTNAVIVPDWSTRALAFRALSILC